MSQCQTAAAMRAPTSSSSENPCVDQSAADQSLRNVLAQLIEQVTTIAIVTCRDPNAALLASTSDAIRNCEQALSLYGNLEPYARFYAALRRTSIHVHAYEKAARNGSHDAVEVALLRASLHDEIDAGITRAAWDVTQLPALTLEDVRAKATVLADWVGHEHTDVADQLARSLCTDILELQEARELRGSR